MTHPSTPLCGSAIARAPRLILAACVATAAATLAACSDPAAAQAAAPKGPDVSVAPAVRRSLSDAEEFTGRLEAPDYVDLRPRVAGTIDSVHFVDGASVRKGDMLFTIDPRPFQAEAAHAESLLASARARSELAQSELARSKTLLDSHAASRQEFDELSASLRTSQADSAGAEAALRLARLNLEFTQVRAPISGRISRAEVTAGNLVDVRTVLTSLTGVARIYAYFDASEQSYLRLRAQTAAGKVPVVRLGLANEAGFPHEGRLDFVDNRLNPRTGSIRLRASFDNAQGEFTPGLAAHVSMVSPVVYDAVMVPERAIGTDQTQKFVYVVGGDGVPQVREVTPGALFGGMRVVQGAVKAGDNVVVEGLQRVIPGVPVTPHVLKVDASGLPVAPVLAPKA